MLTINRATPGEPEVQAIIAAHAVHCNAASPEESCHFLTGPALAAQDVAMWAARSDGQIAGIGALRVCADDSGEIKSMHTLSAMRGRGVAAAILAAIIAEARARGLTALRLETGSNPAFAPARGLYEQNGFRPCDAFGSYVADPFSAFYELRLDAVEEAI